MKKKIIIWSSIIVILILLFYYIDKECGIKTTEIGTKAQLGLTGIYLTVLDYKEINPLKDDPTLNFDKYIAFEILLEGRANRRFGDAMSNYPIDTYDFCGFFFLEGEKDGEQQNQGALHDEKIVKLFGTDFPAIGIGKISDDKKAHGYVIFGIPEGFKPRKFIYRYHTQIDLYKASFPNTAIHVIFNNLIS